MAITNKTRKLLWGLSGYRCAICQKELIIDATPNGNISIVGEECHINSGQVNGPRYNFNISPNQIDRCDNLLLLCKSDHKIIDDDPIYYSDEKLRKIKVDHEKWVSEKLSNDRNKQEPIRIKRLKKNIPKHLIRITTGKDLFNSIRNCVALYHGYDELKSEKEIEIVTSFFKLVEDLDNYFDSDIGGEIKIVHNINNIIKEIEDCGFYIFGAIENQIIEGGIGGPANWPVFHIRVIRNINDTIIKI